MTLLSTLHIAKNALFMSQAGIQVAANNIANADTPGYVREKLVVATGPPQRLGRLVQGGGVDVLGVVRELDQFLQQRVWTALSDRAGGDVQSKAYLDLEAVIGELSDTDLSTALNDFFHSLHDVLNHPEDRAIRNLAVHRGAGLADQIQSLNARVRELSRAAHERILSGVERVNQLVTDIAKLNRQIIDVEHGGLIVSDAVGLRDRRDLALDQLSQLVDIRVDEQASGAVNVFVGGEYLVFDGATQHIRVDEGTESGLPAGGLRLSQSDAPLRATSGELAGLLAARDEIFAGFLSELDAFARSLIFEFNQIHASGQGLTGYASLSSEHGITDPAVPLDEAGLPFTPVHGSFQVHIVNRATGITNTHDIRIRLNGLEDDTTFADLVASFESIDGLSAEVTDQGRLVLRTESPDLVFTFADDSSGALASLGMNGFFAGSGAGDIQVGDTLRGDAGKLAISRGGLGQDTHNGELLTGLFTAPLERRDGVSLKEWQHQWMGETAQASALAGAVAEGYRAFHATLEGEHLGISGVSLDEEAVNMMTYQRAFQASAKVISTISQLLDVLVNL
jgi:flagellar hook-associated protein 1